MKKVAFICTANACRSQIAEGLARHLAGDRLEVYSAGSHPCGSVISGAIAVMREIGIDITKQYSKGLDDIPIDELDTLVTLCSHADQYCPTLPRPAQKLRWPMPDPVSQQTDPSDPLCGYRKVRDAIQSKIEEWLKTV